MKWLRRAAGLAVLLVVGAALASGGAATDSARLRYLPDANALRTVSRFGGERRVTVTSLGNPDVVRPDPRWLAAARPLGAGAPSWARRMYSRSLLVFHGLVDPRSGAAIAGAREGWAYVWPRDASAVAIALVAAGYRSEARRIVRFLRGLDLDAAARFQTDGTPVDGRGAQGDASGGSPRPPGPPDCRTPLRSGRGEDWPTTRRTAAAISSPTRSPTQPPTGPKAEI